MRLVYRTDARKTSYHLPLLIWDLPESIGPDALRQRSTSLANSDCRLSLVSSARECSTPVPNEKDSNAGIGRPTDDPNPRITLQVEDARETEKQLTDRAVTISDPVKLYEDKFWVGGFLDSEGNKLWFCSYALPSKH